MKTVTTITIVRNVLDEDKEAARIVHGNESMMLIAKNEFEEATKRMFRVEPDEISVDIQLFEGESK